MSNWRNRPPLPEDFETEEEYQEAEHMFDSAIDSEIEMDFIRKHENNHN